MGYFRLFPLHGEADGLIPRGTRAEVFREIFIVFLVLGVLVGVVVIGYMVYNAYKYRDGNGKREFTPPALGELPSGSEGGRKLAYSFSLSAIIVLSLILWTYGTLLYVESDEPAEHQDALEVKVVGSQFSWTFIYPNGHESDTLRVPKGKEVKLIITSDDVFHTFGVPELRVKMDAIPGQQTDTWFIGDETGTYEARCFELCGAGHSYMTAEVIVMEADKYQEWYANTGNSTTTTNNSTSSSNTTTNNSTTTTTTA